MRKRGGKSKLDSLYAEADAARAELQITNSLTTSDYQEVYDLAAQAWGDRLGEKWMPVSRKNHHCVPDQCEMEQLKICSIFCTRNGDHFLHHLCTYVFRGGKLVGPACRGRVADHRQAEAEFVKGAKGVFQCVQISDAYMCARTGLMHICRVGMCEYVDSTEQHVRRGESTCVLTGNVLEDSVFVDKFWCPQSVANTAQTSRLSWSEISRGKRAFNSVWSEKNGLPQITWGEALADIEQNLLTEMCDIDDIRYYLTKRRPKKNVDSPLSEFCAIALLRVASLFCRTRFTEDLKNAQEARRLANRSVLRAINRDEPDSSAIGLRNMQKVGLDARPVPANILLSGKARRNFFMIYAMRALKLWLVVRTRTRLGCEDPGLFPFSDFVIAAMYIQRDGVKVPGSVTGGNYSEIVLKEDLVLKKVLPSTASFEKMDCDRAVVMNLMKQINIALIDAIRDERRDPRELEPDSINIESVPPSVFAFCKKQKDKK